MAKIVAHNFSIFPPKCGIPALFCRSFVFVIKIRVQKRESEIICIANRWFIERPQSFAWCHGEQGTGDRQRYASKTHDNLLRKIDDVFSLVACDFWTDLNAKIDSISRKENSWDSFYKQTFRSDVLQMKWNFKSFPIMLAIKNSLRMLFLFVCVSLKILDFDKCEHPFYRCQSHVCFECCTPTAAQ